MHVWFKGMACMGSKIALCVHAQDLEFSVYVPVCFTQNA